MHIYIPGINYTKYIFMYIHINVAVFWVLVACLARVQYFCGSRGKACFVCAGMHIISYFMSQRWFTVVVARCGEKAADGGVGGPVGGCSVGRSSDSALVPRFWQFTGVERVFFLWLLIRCTVFFFFVSSLWQARQLK